MKATVDFDPNARGHNTHFATDISKDLTVKLQNDVRLKVTETIQLIGMAEGEKQSMTMAPNLCLNVAKSQFEMMCAILKISGIDKDRIAEVLEQTLKNFLDISPEILSASDSAQSIFDKLADRASPIADASSSDETS